MNEEHNETKPLEYQKKMLQVSSKNLPSLTGINTNKAMIAPETIRDMQVMDQEKIFEIAEYIDTDHQEMLHAFSRSQSGFMATMLTLSGPTPIRNLRQIGAEIEKKRMALAEAQFTYREKIIEFEETLEKLNDSEGNEKRKLLLSLEKAEYYKNSSLSYVEAALKALLSLKRQYDSIKKHFNIEHVTEEAFEQEEEEFHIKQAFTQAIEDVVASGRISVGNSRYLMQIGIMPTIATNIVVDFVQRPEALQKENLEKFLDACYKKMRGCSFIEAKRRGMETTFFSDTVFKGDTEGKTK